MTSETMALNLALGAQCGKQIVWVYSELDNLVWVKIRGDSPLWSPFKALYSVVNNAVVNKDISAVPDLEVALKNHKSHFICLLKNPARNRTHREAVKNASTSGIAVVGQPGLQVLSPQLVDEALIISDMFELNELAALELLIAGQQQQPHFPGLTRGLVAMLLYYDGRRSLVSSLRCLVQASEGRSWTLGLSSELTALITNYTNQLKEEGLIIKIIDLVENMDVSKELDLLHKNRALGGPRYRKQVTDLITEIKQSLAETVFCWACQSTLTCEDTNRLMTYLSEVSTVSSDVSLDEATLTLVMAFLYVIDVGYLQTCEELDPGIKNLNLFHVPDIAPPIHKQFYDSPTAWKLPELKSIFQFAWGVTLRTLSQFPSVSIGNYTPGAVLGDSLEDDEKIVENAIEGGVFLALNNLIVQTLTFHEEEFYLKRIHNLITDFIVLMPIKVKDMRNRGDESAKIIAAHVQEGLEPPTNLPLHFQHFLNSISKIYEKNPLGLDLALDFWCPVENYSEQSFSARPTQRQVALFKFVRLAGDLLPAPLFVPYHEMLKSLSSSKLCAHHCFNLLKMNGQNVVGGNYCIVSWDHFFSTLYKYYNHLREEVAVARGVGYTSRQRMLTKGITPQEVQGLAAVLNLISQVVKLDDVARLTLAENPQYAPFTVLFGLITCSIPSVLKSALIYCLAAFGSSSDTAINVWHGLESAQIIPTGHSMTVYHPSGILTELEEVETRNEEYPVTRAVLKLIGTLLKKSTSIILSPGQSQPGLQPYVDFVRDKIFLKCNARVFKNQKEKWQIITACLKIFYKILQNYHIQSQNINQSPVTVASSHPGYSILSEMLQDSGLLRTVLCILDEGVRLLDLYASFPGQSQLEKSVLLALSVLQCSISKQDAFLQLVRDIGCDLLVTSLDNLLMGINPRTGEADHLYIISKYITYNTLIPQHSLLSIRILHMLCSSSYISQHLISVFDVEPSESDILLHGFVECLEVDVTGEDEEEKDESKEESMTQVRNRIRAELLTLLLNCLKFPGPNLSHYLLGFNLRRPVNQTEIQEPGVMGSRRTCLHAVLALLDAGTNTGAGPVNVLRSPLTINLAYQLIYTLCSNNDTSGPILRYLRSTHDFFYRHLQFLPFKSIGGLTSKLLSLESWFLKALAIELRVTSAHHQRSHVQRLLQLLLEDKPPVDSGTVDGITEPASGMSNMTTYSFIQPNIAPLRRKLMQILDSLDFGQSTLTNPQLDYFDINELQKVFKECEVVQPSGVYVIDIRELDRRLKVETSVLQCVPGFSQRAYVFQQEMSVVLKYAADINDSRLKLFAKRQSFNAWRQVVEIILIASPLDVVGNEKKHQVVVEISQELIRRVVSADFSPELMPAASGVILTLMATLRHSIMSSINCKLPYLLPESGLTSLSNTVTPSKSQVAVTHHSSLLVVLKAIVECLLQIGSGLQRVRANFYAALLNLLSIAQKPYDVQTDFPSSVESAVLDKQSENRKLRMEFMDTLLSFGEMIMEVICRDACTGHDVTKMLSLAVLDAAISLDTQEQWLAFLVSKGYLRHILDSLKQDDEQLQNLLNRNSVSFRIFYVFESKMALLTRISTTATGALSLLRNGVFGKLAECRALDLRPDEFLSEEVKKESEKWLLLDLLKCYRQILKAVMKLILSISMALGSQHQEVTLQLLGYISCNMDFFLNILRDRSIFNSLAGLEELSLITAVLARASLDDPDRVAEDTVLLESRGQFLLLRQHLLIMLPYLLANENSVFWGRSASESSDADVIAKVRLTRLQIASHILGMCCSAGRRSGLDASGCKVLFGPSLSEASSSIASYPLSSQDILIQRPRNAGRMPDLGLLVTLLIHCCTQLPNNIENHKLLLMRLQSLSTLTTDELSEYLPSETKVEQTTGQQQRELARDCLLDLLQYRVKEVGILSYMLESSAYILLRHLEYYLPSSKKSVRPLTSTDKELSIRRLQDFGFSPARVHKEEMNRSTDTMLNPQELENFKTEVLTVISDSFFHKLQSAQQHLSKGRSHVSFLEAITHRIKRLVKLQTR